MENETVAHNGVNVTKTEGINRILVRILDLESKDDYKVEILPRKSVEGYK